MPKVLIVEDDDTTVRLVKYILEKKQYEVLDCNNGSRVLDIVIQEKPDLILMDIIIPEIDGIEVMKLIREYSDEEISKIPILILTALGQESDITKGYNFGADGYILKPFTSETLIVQVEKQIFKD